MCLQNYEILSGDTLVATWQNKRLNIIDSKLLPLFLKYYSDADMWLASRAIDSHRPNSRLLKKALRMTERDDVATVLRANGVTITDNYWVREIGSTLAYRDVCFDSAYFRKKVSQSGAKLALSGSQTSFQVVAEHSAASSAELTNIGSFEKCWKNEDGQWWLYKNANNYEAFSEIFIYHLCTEIGINCSVYEKNNKCVKTLDFTNGESNFEPAFAFMGNDEDYENILSKLTEICPKAIPDFVRMIFLDALVFNPDRHTANFGLLREKSTGEYIGFAPCFDHNMALISRGYPSKKQKPDLLITLFADFITAHPNYAKYIPVVSEKVVQSAIDKVGLRVKSSEVTRFIMFRYNAIMDSINCNL